MINLPQVRRNDSSFSVLLPHTHVAHARARPHLGVWEKDVSQPELGRGARRPEGPLVDPGLPQGLGKRSPP